MDCAAIPDSEHVMDCTVGGVDLPVGCVQLDRAPSCAEDQIVVGRACPGLVTASILRLKPPARPRRRRDSDVRMTQVDAMGMLKKGPVKDQEGRCVGRL